MRWLERLGPRLLAPAVCVAFAAISAAAGGADGTSLRQRASDLRAADDALAQRAHRSLLDLYALDTKLTQAQARVSSLTMQAAHLRAERASVLRQLLAAKSTMRASQKQLELRLRALYEQNDVDALAAVLGASSLTDAITSLDDLTRSAELNRRVTRQAGQARALMRRLSAKLAARDARLRALSAEAQSTLASLSAQRAARTAFVAGLRARRRLNAAEVARLDARATAAAARSVTVAASAPAAPPPTVSQPASGSTLTVVATGYSMSGSTSTGVPVGWGVAAVDPAVIPLGTHLAVPGYGSAVAADIGSAVQGSVIDLWFPTDAQALAWGRRTVTITLQ